MTEVEAKKLLLEAYSKEDLRSRFKEGHRSIKVPITTGSALMGTYKFCGSWDFKIIELLNDL